MKYIAIDIEAIGLKPYGGTIWMLSITEDGKTELIEDCNGIKKLSSNIKKKLEDENYCKIIHSSEYDGPYIALVLGCRICNIWDSQLNEIIIQGMRVSAKSKDELLKQQYSTSLKYVLPRYGYKEPKKDLRLQFINREKGIPFSNSLKKYAIDDTKDLIKIQRKQFKILQQEQSLPIAELENKVAEKIIQMRVYGIGFDSNEWERIAEENEIEYASRMRKLSKYVDNWGSPKQVKQYFASEHNIRIDSFKNIYKIYLQTRNKTLAQFIWAKEIRVSITKYGLNWFENGYIDADNRIRCNVDQIVDTGRMSISNPPLQGMPGVDIKVRQRLQALDTIVKQLKLSGRSIPQHRRAFVSKPGYSFVNGDFTGQELGVMAAASGEKLWIDAMLRGEDVHSLMASLMFQNEWSNATMKGCTFPFKCKCPGHIELREPAKTLNFMLAYGGGSTKFSEDTGIELDEAKNIIHRYKRIIPTLTNWLDKNGKQGLYSGYSYSADPYKRKRKLNGEEDWQIINQAKNHPIQSAGANMLKLAMVSIPDKYPIVLVIHDQIILEVKDLEAEKAAKVLKTAMENAANYITGIEGLIRVKPVIGKNLMK